MKIAVLERERDGLVRREAGSPAAAPRAPRKVDDRAWEIGVGSRLKAGLRRCRLKAGLQAWGPSREIAFAFLTPHLPSPARGEVSRSSCFARPEAESAIK